MDTDQLKRLTAPFPKDALKTREGGRGKQLTYVAGHTVIHRLNDATGNNWNLEILSVTSEQITAYGKPAEQVRAHVRLTIPGLGSREHVGVQILSAGGGEDLYKGAITDALKKAATLYGVGLELYGEDFEDESYQPAQARPTPRPAPTPPRPASVSQASPQVHQGPQQTIDAAQVRIIQALCDCKGISAESICKRFKVPSLPEMKPADFWTAKQGLEAMPDDAPAEASS